MMVPTCPMAHLIIGQTGFTLAALETFFHTMFRCGHPGTFLQGRLGCRVGQGIIHLHDLLLSTVAGAEHHQRLLIALLTPMGTRCHASFDHVDDQGALRSIADVDPLPGVIAECLTPLCQGRLGRRPRPRDSGTSVSRSRRNVLAGTANRSRSPKVASRRRNHEGRPIASSPAIQRCGSAAPCVASISHAHW